MGIPATIPKRLEIGNPPATGDKSGSPNGEFGLQSAISFNQRVAVNVAALSSLWQARFNPATGFLATPARHGAVTNPIDRA